MRPFLSAVASDRWSLIHTRRLAPLVQVQTAPATQSRLLPAPDGDLRIAEAPDPRLGPAVKLSLIIPTYNEAKNIGPLVARLDELLAAPLHGSYELIVVDDDSPDRTWEVAQRLCEKHGNLRVIRRQGERGLSTAVIRGWQCARGEVLGVMDADLQHPPEVNLGLWSEMEKGADLAAGSRHVEGGGVSDWSMARRILSRGAQLLGLLILPGVLGRLSDPMSGYFMVRRSALAGVKLDPIGYKILVEVVGRANVRWIGEVGYVFRERIEGASKVTWRLYIHYLRHLLRLRLSTLGKSRFFRFCVVGATGVVVDMALLFILSDPRMLGLGLTRSKVLAAEAAIFSNFMLNDAWTFGDLAAKSRGFRAKVRRFLAFNAICAIGLGLNVLLLNLLFNYGHVNRYLANAIAILAVTAWNYGLNRHLNWAPLKTQER
jgi:dolichol-phosphate mannosyltransferase